MSVKEYVVRRLVPTIVLLGAALAAPLALALTAPAQAAAPADAICGPRGHWAGCECRQN